MFEMLYSGYSVYVPHYLRSRALAQPDRSIDNRSGVPPLYYL